MKRISVTVPVPDGQSKEERRKVMARVARDVGELGSGVTVESVGLLVVVAQVPDEQVERLYGLGYLVNVEPPGWIVPEG